MRHLFLLTALPLLLLSADPLKLDPAKGRDIANLESNRNAIAAEFHAARAAAAQLEALQKALQEADSAYRAAIEAERAAAKLDPRCRLVKNITWDCPDKPVAVPKPSTPEKPEKLEKEKP